MPVFVSCACGLMAGLQRCASHGGVIQSRGWLPKVEALGYSRHPTSTKRCRFCEPTNLSFMSTGIIAVSCGEGLSFDDRVDNFSHILMTSSLVLIWSFSDPIHPLVSNFSMNVL